MKMLPRKERLRLQSVSESVRLLSGEVLCEKGQSIRYVYFPTHSFISLITVIDEKPVLEVGMVGREGMVGVQLVLGIKISPFHTLVQGAGTANRIAVGDFCGELDRSAALRQCLQRYLYVLMAQLASTAACTRFHLIGQRLARWLLMTQDRAGSDRFHVTHEFLAYMLGVRRVGVTNAATDLQRAGLIEYHRGELIVLDRRGLEAAACGCYAADRQAYTKFLSKPRAIH
jgi:CRP-like cAMP-binding protein